MRSRNTSRWYALLLFRGSGCTSKPATNTSEQIATRRSLSGRLVGRGAERRRPGWEILPQEAGPGEVILSKRNELGLLSNFAATPFEFRGKRYASLEGFWQMMKYPEGPDDPRAKFPGLEWTHTRDEVAEMTAFDAKKAGDLASRNMARWASIGSRSKANSSIPTRRAGRTLSTSSSRRLGRKSARTRT